MRGKRTFERVFFHRFLLLLAVCALCLTASAAWAASYTVADVGAFAITAEAVSPTQLGEFGTNGEATLKLTAAQNATFTYVDPSGIVRTGSFSQSQTNAAVLTILSSASGTVTVTATSGAQVATATITVVRDVTPGLSLSPKSLMFDQKNRTTQKVILTINPYTDGDPYVTYEPTKLKVDAGIIVPSAGGQMAQITYDVSPATNYVFSGVGEKVAIDFLYGGAYTASLPVDLVGTAPIVATFPSELTFYPSTRSTAEIVEVTVSNYVDGKLLLDYPATALNVTQSALSGSGTTRTARLTVKPQTSYAFPNAGEDLTLAVSVTGNTNGQATPSSIVVHMRPETFNDTVRQNIAGVVGCPVSSVFALADTSITSGASIPSSIATPAQISDAYAVSQNLGGTMVYGGAAAYFGMSFPLNNYAIDGTTPLLPHPQSMSEFLKNYSLLKVFSTDPNITANLTGLFPDLFSYDPVTSMLTLNGWLVFVDGQAQSGTSWKQGGYGLLRKKVGDINYLYVFDGQYNGYVDDPIALVKKPSQSGGGSSSGGCDAFSVPLALVALAAVGAVRRFKR